VAEKPADEVLRFVLRFLPIAAVMGLFGLQATEPATRALLPLFKWELAVLDDTFRVDRLSIDHDGADQVVRLDVGLARPLTLNGRTFRPDPRGKATASTLVGNLILPCVLLTAVTLAWPIRGWRRLPTRVLLLLPALLLLCLLVVPFLLLGALWGMILDAADPNRFSVLLTWSDFLLGGGSLALAMALGAAVGSLTGRSSRYTSARS
jgi:hypothetical protein